VVRVVEERCQGLPRRGGKAVWRVVRGGGRCLGCAGLLRASRGRLWVVWVFEQQLMLVIMSREENLQVFVVD